MKVQMAISSNHRRVLQNALAELENLLLHLERALGEPPLLGYLYREENSLLGHPYTEALQEEVMRLRDELRRLGIELGLSATEQDRLGEFRSRLALQWVDLEGLRPRRLAAYGKVSAELAEVLEVGLDRLEQGIKRIEVWLAKVGEGHV
ncbi:MAG TPA: hypothetical protein VFS50_13560 [Meiothermus sp.]|nr:hypothetical protein [Meiothermus sp.]